MKQYLDLLKHVLENGQYKEDRTGTGVYSVFGYQMRFDLSEGFPLVTTKKIHLKSIIHEILWMLSGSCDEKDLQKVGVTIWREWATAEQCAKFGRKEGQLGPIYSHQWRNFGATKNLNWKPFSDEPEYLNDGKDQISWVINEIKTNPNSRRLIVSGWDPNTQDKVALPPCHTLFQFYVQNGKLSCHLYQRSNDLLLGNPYNIASYSLLTMMIAQVTGLQPGEFVHTISDAHIYSNHLEQVKLQLTREPYPLPKMILNPEVKNIFDFKYEDFTLIDYQCHPAIKAPVAV